MELLESRRLLAVLTVSNLNDSGGGSLRGAIALANANVGTDVIEFVTTLSGGSISLSTGEIQINEALEIDARPLAQNVTVDAHQLSRIFNITAATGDFTFGGLTLTGGKTTDSGLAGVGGAVRSLTTGNLTLDQSVVTGNSTTGNGAGGGGIASLTLTLVQSTVSGNSATGDGGGILASDGVALTQSTVSGNRTTENGARGGGIWASYGGVTLAQSTVSGNSTAGDGAHGGGIYAIGSVTLTQSTISGNSTEGASSYGGGIRTSGFVTLTNSTVSGNSTAGFGARGGGIWTTSAVILSHSTVTDNRANAIGGGVFQAFSSYPCLIDDSIVAGNMVGNTVGVFGADLVNGLSSTLTVNYSLIGTGVTPTSGGNNVVTNNPLLGPLANNGGPTQTHALLATSPALNAGDPSATGFDQRGAPFVRVFDGRADIGAYERQSVTGLNLVVDTAIDENDGYYSAAHLSLREAIGLANGSLGAGTIAFAAALSGQTIFLGGTELAISEALEIDARPLAQNVTVDAHQLSRIFNITAATGDFTFGGLTLTGGKTTDSGLAGVGGAVRSLTTGNLTLDQSVVTGNSTTGNGAYGGGIWASSVVTLTNSNVSGNSTTGSSAEGGGIWTYSAATLAQSTVSGNSTVGSGAGGGGIWARGSVTLTQSTVNGNSTTGGYALGGGIYSREGGVTLTNSTVSGNSTAGSFAGGGGLVAHGNVTLTGSTVSGNRTMGDEASGGGISGGTMMLTRSTVSGNSTGGFVAFGGGIAAGGPMTLIQSTISGNSTTGSYSDGGGIWAFGNVTLTETTVTNNRVMYATAKGGGVIQGNPALIFTISGSIVAGNMLGNNVGVGGSDLVKSLSSPLTVNYSLIGTGVTPTSGGNNVVTNNPLLGPLANNGGPNQTHALLATSPALNAGDPSATGFDQRGAPFVRVFDGRADIGAIEMQPPALLGDYNLSQIVEGGDYVLWRKTLGTIGLPKYSGADGDGDGTIDQDDYGMWRAHFGESLPPQGAGSGASVEVGPGSGEGERSSVESQESRVGTEAITNIGAAADVRNLAVRALSGVNSFGTAKQIGHGESTAWTRSGRRASEDRTRVDGHWRDVALLAWLGLRGDGRKEDIGETDVVGDGQGWPSHDRAVDDALDELRVAVVALV